MVILDTNVISEVVRPKPESAVISWLGAQPRTTLYITTITRGELLYGAEILPEGERRIQLKQQLQTILDQEFSGQILPFDNRAANQFALIAAKRRQQGMPISQFDAMIAAIARSHEAKLATRNTRDFIECGIELINPWESIN